MVTSSQVILSEVIHPFRARWLEYCKAACAKLPRKHEFQELLYFSSFPECEGLVRPYHIVCWSTLNQRRGLGNLSNTKLVRTQLSLCTPTSLAPQEGTLRQTGHRRKHRRITGWPLVVVDFYMFVEEFTLLFSERVCISGLPPVLDKDFSFLSNSCSLQTGLALKFPFLINPMLPSHLLGRCLFPPRQLHEDSQI